MRKVWLVFKREYLTRVRTKGFVIGTIVVPIGMIVILVLPMVLATRQAARTMRIALLDETGSLAAGIAQGLDQKLPNGEPAYRIVQTVESPRAEEGPGLREELRAEVSQGELDGFLIVPKGLQDGQAAAFYTRNPGDLTSANTIRGALSDAAIAQRLKERGVQVKNVRDLMRSVKLSLVKVTEEGEVEEKGQTIATAIVMMFFLYMTIFVYGLMTLNSVQEEKSTRIVEVLVSSLRPHHLLSGKLLGVGAVGFTQFLIWTVSGALLGAYGAMVVGVLNPTISLPHIQIPWSTIAYLVIFYVAGYFLYASLYAAIAAMASSTEEAQHVATPVNILLGFAPIMLGLVVQNPNSTPAIVLSMIPFFAPIHMVLRIALQTPPFWQIALSIGLIILTTIGVVYVSAKVYRVGILMYGKRPSLAEVLRWLRYT